MPAFAPARCATCSVIRDLAIEIWFLTGIRAENCHSLRRGVFTLKSAVERGSFDQTMDEMDIVDPVDFTRKGIDFLVHFVHKVHDLQRIAHRIRS